MPSTIKGRVSVDENGAAEVRLLIRHPMSIGRLEAGTGTSSKPHFIECVTIHLNNKLVMEMVWGWAVSKNPFISFSLKNVRAGDILAVKWIDNYQQSDTGQFTVT